MIDIVFFDGDQTLWDFETIMRRSLDAAVRELHDRRDVDPSLVTIDALIADRDSAAAEMSGTSLADVRKAGFARTLSRIGQADDDLADHLASIYVEHRHAVMMLFPETEEALRELGRHYKLGLLTNGNSEPNRHTIGGYLEFQLFADDIGARKPDRRVYDIAANVAGASPDRAVMVGDSLVNDVVAAQEAGWRGVWINRDGQAAGDHRPDAIITSLTELPTQLAAW